MSNVLGTLGTGTNRLILRHNVPATRHKQHRRRMTKVMREVKEAEYEQRLTKTKLMSLEIRRLRSDLIEVYKIMHNLEGLEREDFFPLRSAGRRGHQYTITKQYRRLNSRKYFFSQRVVDQWNRLPTTTVCAESINRFKNQIDQMLWQHGGLFISQRRLPVPRHTVPPERPSLMGIPVGAGE